MYSAKVQLRLATDPDWDPRFGSSQTTIGGNNKRSEGVRMVWNAAHRFQFFDTEFVQFYRATLS